MCPDAVKVAREYQVISRIVTTGSTFDEIRITANARRQWIRFAHLMLVDPAAVTDALLVYLKLDAIPVCIGKVTPYIDGFELSFEKHGQAVYGPFGLWTVSGSGLNVHITEAIATTDLAKV